MISKKAYRQIVEEHSQRVYGYLINQIKDKELAKDFTQDALLKLWENRFFVKEETAKSWLFKTAYRRMLNYVRDNKRLDFKEELSSDFIVQNSFKQLEANDLLDVVFKRMSIDEKTIIILRDQEGYSYQEIAQIIEVNEGIVKNRLFNARKKFSLELEKLKVNYYE